MPSTHSETPSDDAPASDAEPDEQQHLPQPEVELEPEQRSESDAQVEQQADPGAEVERASTRAREREIEQEQEREREREQRLKDDVRRYYALAELVDTERAYVRDLRVLVEVRHLPSLVYPPSSSHSCIPNSLDVVRRVQRAASARANKRMQRHAYRHIPIRVVPRLTTECELNALASSTST